ncbi:hypothetical protein [Novosphingobium sp. MMS21-SN21R]|uniref:hypothetical protein n=1 Tax=Novosphingobium sp. MMS21-SN21R TaxID=2969298 RepID=UPI0028886890|nr:hypothetical protein [Novosphingobium sp. MMS21-SN21R]MDT0506939.1 hypothetical protein [Novosphingobium sp. MMS21-SN21R]
MSIKKALLVACTALSLGFGAANTAYAAMADGVTADPVVLKGDVLVEKKVVENGAETIKLVEPASVVPGDRLLFRTRYSNTGKSAVDAFVVTNPVPTAVTVAAPSTDALEVSVDGGKAFARLGQLSLADGKGGMRRAVATDITHIRWTIPQIAPGASGSLEYHAVVR